jgi:hypothetical protein
MAWTQEEINEVYTKAMQKATTDEEFRQELLENPKSAIKKLTGEALPDDYKIKVIEESTSEDVTNTDIPTFILPKQKRNELDLEDLDSVAGGIADCYSDDVIGCPRQVANYGSTETTKS